MRRILFLLLVTIGLLSQSWAANKIQSVTVDQLGQWLSGVRDESDSRIAKELENKVLIERVGAAQLAQWQSALPGRHSRSALTAMADVSMFLPPPPASVLSDPPPDIKTQGEIVSHAIDYVVQTLGKLPDFSAACITKHFEDDPAHQGMTSYSMRSANSVDTGLGSPYTLGIPSVSTHVFGYQPLHLTSESTMQVSYRDGVETSGSQKLDVATVNRVEPRLVTAGEFGPILSVVLRDAMHGSLDWGYWQQSPYGKLAVFHYSVADGQSHYVVALRHGIQEEKLSPAYHGEISIDPATGAVLRIILVANSLRSQDVMESAMAVEYGPVVLGGKSYICVLKGIALLKSVVNSGGLKTEINDATFSDYHLMRGDLTILPSQ